VSSEPLTSGKHGARLPEPEGRYRALTPGSESLWRRAADSFPQGVSGQAKYYAPYPVFVAAASGSTITDVDGRRYIDLLMGAGPLLLGHSHPAVVEAVQRQAALMTNPMAPHEGAIAFAERLRRHMPYLERLRFVNTGSEATRSAIRVARAVTGRTKIAKFEGNYHGSDDFALISTHSRDLRGADDRPMPTVDYAGVSRRLLDEVLVLPYNDGAAATQAISEHASELAAVIMEPVSFSSGGGVPADPEFVLAVREVTRANGIVLIFDEVLTALRLGLGGAPDYLGVTPDLSTIGKAVGGGLPLAAFGGRADLMEAALGTEAGARRIFQSGTFTENPLSIAAGNAAVTVLEQEPALERANAAGDRLRVGLRAVFAGREIAAAVTGVGSIAQVHLGATEVRNRRDVVRSDQEQTRRLLLGLIAEGVLWPPIHPAVTSAAHTEGQIDEVLAAVESVLDAATGGG
jgi:glutamate-1-semialdehyde 2,1-aminomutase